MSDERTLDQLMRAVGQSGGIDVTLYMPLTRRLLEASPEELGFCGATLNTFRKSLDKLHIYQKSRVDIALGKIQELIILVQARLDQLDLELRLIDVMWRYPWRTAAELAPEVGESTDSIHNKLVELRNRGYAMASEERGIWCLLPPGAIYRTYLSSRTPVSA